MARIMDNKRWLAVLIVFIFFSSNAAELSIGATNVVASAQFQSSVSLSSLGLISYPTSPSSMPFTGLGGDYLLTFGGGDANVWNESGYTYQGIYRSWAEWSVAFDGYHTTRLGINFDGVNQEGSILEITKLKEVLTIFDSVGSKVIILMQNRNNFHYPTNWMFSSEYLNYWTELTTDLVNDDRVAAFSLWGEVNPYDFPGHTRAEVAQAFADVINAIHVIDPDRVVIFPTPVMYTFTPWEVHDGTNWFQDIDATEIQNDQYVIFDILHPYYFEMEYDMGLNVEQKVAWYVDNWIAPSVAKFGANRCYAGETFPWTGGQYTPSIQHEWMVRIINAYDLYSISFTIWCNLGFPTQMNAIIPAMQASKYP